MKKINSRSRIIAVLGFAVTVLAGFGRIAVYATTPWRKPTDPDVRLKPWKCSRRSSDNPPSCTAVFYGQCRMPNPLNIGSQTTFAHLNKQCPYDPTINEIEFGKDPYDPEIMRWWMGAATIRSRTHPVSYVLYDRRFHVDCDHPGQQEDSFLEPAQKCPDYVAQDYPVFTTQEPNNCGLGFASVNGQCQQIHPESYPAPSAPDDADERVGLGYTCSDGIDNDGNGLTDSADSKC